MYISIQNMSKSAWWVCRGPRFPELPGGVETAPERPPRASKWRQNAPEEPPCSPRGSRDYPRRPSGGPKCFPDGHMSLKDAPPMAPQQPSKVATVSQIAAPQGWRGLI